MCSLLISLKLNPFHRNSRNIVFIWLKKATQDDVPLIQVRHNRRKRAAIGPHFRQSILPRYLTADRRNIQHLEILAVHPGVRALYGAPLRLDQVQHVLVVLHVHVHRLLVHLELHVVDSVRVRPDADVHGVLVDLHNDLLEVKTYKRRKNQIA